MRQTYYACITYLKRKTLTKLLIPSLEILKFAILLKEKFSEKFSYLYLMKIQICFVTRKIQIFIIENIDQFYDQKKKNQNYI